jgi:hypothetical protein
MGKYIKEKWAELLVGAILIPFIAAIFAIVWTMRGDLSKVDGTLDSVVHRVNRIAEVLPDLRVRLAYEEINKTPKTLILSTTPYKKGDAWTVTLNIVDTTNGAKKIYSLQEINQKQAKFAVAGLVYSIDATANSFTDMEKYSVDVKQAKFAPSIVEKSSSFVSYREPEEIAANLKILGYQPQEEKPSTFTITYIRDWPSTVDALATGTVTVTVEGTVISR